MSEENTAVATPEIPAAATPPKKSAGKKKKKARKIRNAIIAVVVIAALAVGGFFLWKFLNKKEEVNSELQTAMADWGSISSTVQGQGSARAKESAAITLTQTGTVQQLFVNAGDMVTAGQPLYTIFSQAAEDEVRTRRDNLDAAQERISDAMKSMAEIQKDIADLQAKQGKLTVRAPFAGKVTEVESFTVNKRVGEGSKVCTLVNDRKMKLSLYFSYAYENAISVGQKVDVSIPAVMQSYTGKVEQINKVHYITPEGADHFEVTVSFENQGTLTEGMTATAALTAADGTPIYPYSGGQTEYYEVREVVTEVEGPVVSSNLLRYANVNAGDVLLTLSSDALDEQIRTRRGEMNVPPSRKVKLTIASADAQAFQDGAAFFGRLASASEVEVISVEQAPTSDEAQKQGLVEIITHAARIFMPLAELVDMEQEKARLDKEIAKTQKDLAGLKGKLSNENFVNKAPANVVQAERERLEKLEALLEKLTAQREAM